MSRQLTRRTFLELASAATTSVAMGQGVLHGLTLSGEDEATRRVTIPLNENWRFKRQASPGSAVEPEFVGAEKTGYDDSSWTPVWLPHSWDVTPDNPFATRGHFRGIGWYRTEYNVPLQMHGRRVRLHFKGVCQVADVWLNGHHVGQHTGGYTAFTVDLTDQAEYGGSNVIAVRVDDTLSPYIAPAIEYNVPVYGGIYRTVSLSAVDPVHIAENGLWPTWDSQGSDTLVAFHGVVQNQSSSSGVLKLRFRLLDPAGIVRAEAASGIRVMPGEDSHPEPVTATVAEPQFWSPESPSLYTLLATLYNEHGLVDEYSVRVGIRNMDHDTARGFLLNGQPINLHGMNRRQDYGFLGDAMPEAVGVRDVSLMKNMGVNFIRTAHYPQDPAVLDACDEQGILVWEEIPNIKLNVYPPEVDLAGGAGVSSTRFSRPFMENLKAQLKEMIEQNRHRPSVVIWGLGDDLSLYQYPSDFVDLSNRTHELDATRWTAGRVPHVTDVVDATVYGDLVAQHKGHPEGRYIWNEWGSFHSERGKEGPALIRQGHPPFLPDSEASVICEGLLMQWNALPWLGTLHWCFSDCGEPGEATALSLWEYEAGNPIKPRWPANDYYGCTDMWRIPKNSYYLFQSEWTEKPMIHIVGHWTWPEQPGKPRMVRIYSNCETVELLLNGENLGQHKPAEVDEIWRDFRDLATKYAGFEDMITQLSQDRLPGSFLRHPPFVWRDVPYQPGILKAIGKRNGVQVTDEIRTAGEAAKLMLVSDKSILSADGLDVAFLQTTVLDENGVLVPNASPWISWSVEGPGRLVGRIKEIDAIAGIAAINLQSAGTSGTIKVRAVSEGLKPAVIEIAATR